MAWDASVPVRFEVGNRGMQDVRGHFLAARMLPLHSCAKPLLEVLTERAVPSGSVGWFEYECRSRLGPGRSPCSAVIPWSLPAGVVMDWLAALDAPTTLDARPAPRAGQATGGYEHIFHEHALPLRFFYSDPATIAEYAAGDAAMPLAEFADAERRVTQKLWFCASGGTPTELGRLRMEVGRQLRSLDAHVFFQGRRGLIRATATPDAFRASALVAFHITPALGATAESHVTVRTVTRLVDVHSCGTFGRLLRQCLYPTRITEEDCISTEPLRSDVAYVRVLGLDPPMYTPLAFLRDSLCARDLILHVVVRPHAPLPDAPRPDVLSPTTASPSTGVRAPSPQAVDPAPPAAAAAAAVPLPANLTPVTPVSPAAAAEGS
jgi:hypothetical protein